MENGRKGTSSLDEGVYDDNCNDDDDSELDKGMTMVLAWRFGQSLPRCLKEFNCRISAAKENRDVITARELCCGECHLPITHQ